MPFYGRLKIPEDPYERKEELKKFPLEERVRTAKNLLKLRKQLSEEIPPKTLDKTLLLATWNLRFFSSKNKLTESLFYIAEIISRFDVVALQEIGRDLENFNRLMSILGKRNYRAVISDVTEGQPGNLERSVFVYDTRKATFLDIASKVVLPSDELITYRKKASSRYENDVIVERQFARAPFLAAFQAGWFKFMLCNVHIYYGDIHAGGLPGRIAEIEAITKFINKRAERTEAGDYNYIMLGDFNVVSPDHKTMEPLKEAGFVILRELQYPTDIRKERHYDQIIFKPRVNELQLGDSKRNAGVIDYYRSVFREDELKVYEKYIKEKLSKLDSERKEKFYGQQWRTFQMSDHFPLWVELKIDFAKEYLEESIPHIDKEEKERKRKTNK